VSFLYSQSLKELLANVDDSASKKAEIATENIVLETLRRDEPRARVREGVELFLKDQGDATFGDWLKAAGATAQPDLDAWASLLWPHVQRTMQSPVARAFFEKLTNEFYDGLASGTA